MIKQTDKADCLIIGAGIFGLYAALLLTKKGQRVIILEKSAKAFSRASAINQARVHNGYHYPRSVETAAKSAYYYKQFIRDFDFAINSSFKHIYAIASDNSKTSAKKFIDFCQSLNIDLTECSSKKYFINGSVEAAFLVQEYSFDFRKIREYLLEKIKERAQIYYDVHIKKVKKDANKYTVTLNDNRNYSAPLVINASYAGTNAILDLFSQEPFDLKYELCEVAFCTVSHNLQHVGITVMDGDFFSIMPFGQSKMHTVTSVKHTPRDISYESIANGFMDNNEQSFCVMHHLKQCIICSQYLDSAWSKMEKVSKVFLKPQFTLEHKYSQFEIKAILKASEDDDARPTIIKKHTIKPTFMSVMSGKLNTIYDLEKYL